MHDPEVARLHDGRVHVQYGPIDLLVTIDAPEPMVANAAAQIGPLVREILIGLVDDLATLRSPCPQSTFGVSPTSIGMINAANAVAQHADITPMAAVAGSVADAVCRALWRPGTGRLIVNNGGDIAFKLSEGESITVGLASIADSALTGAVEMDASASVAGVATSGRLGRSLTCGIADSVTAFAVDAAAADAAATAMASAVDLPGSRKVTRRRASDVDESTDLGDRLVVVGVEQLTPDEARRAIGRGCVLANQLIAAGLIAGAVIQLGATRKIVTAGLDLAAPNERGERTRGRPELVQAGQHQASD